MTPPGQKTIRPYHWMLALAASALLHWCAVLPWWSDTGSHSGLGARGSRAALHLRLVSPGVSTGDDSISPVIPPVESMADTAAPEAEASPPPVEPASNPSQQSRSPSAAAELAAVRSKASDALQASETSDAAESLPRVDSAAPLSDGGGQGTKGAAANSVAHSPDPGGAAAATYWGQIVSRVEAALRYPRRALRSGVTGSALVAVRINRAGQLLHCEIARTSGSQLLDRDARATVERASPFGQAPPSLSERDLEFEIPVSYDIAGRPGAAASRRP